MEPTPDMLGFAQRFHELSLNRDSADILIKDLLRYGQDMEGLESNLRHDNLKLKHQLHDRNLDYEDAVRSRRDLQQRMQILETELMAARNGNLKNLNGYVIVLIDGDGLLFKDDFVRQGIAGGKKAAYALRSAILEQCGAHAMGMEVIAKVYVNLAGLCKAMRRDGCLDSETDLKDFTLGFTQAKATFDFIDVGHGKERADNKIKEMARWHLRNDNCKQVILGISHDAGYAPFLDELFQNDAVRRSVTVLQGIPAVREIASTQVNILNLNDFLFRSEKLVDKVILEPKPIQARTPPLLSPGPIEIKAPVAAVTSVVTSVSSKISSASSPAPLSTPATSAVSTPTPAPSVPTTITYAKAMKKPEPVPPAPVVVLPIQSKPPVPRAAAVAAAPKPPAWNPGPRGLDPPLQVSQTALDNIKKRKDHNKLCNNHYLRGPCAKGDACHFEHKYKPTKEEHVAIAFLTRLNPCSQGQDCEVEDCIYGHHCPSVQNGYCTHPYCKFDKEDHPPGTKFKIYKTHDKSSHDRDRER